MTTITAVCPHCKQVHQFTAEMPPTKVVGEANQMPEGQGKRDAVRPRHDLIPLGFLDQLAEIFEEGRRPRPGMPEGYGDSWKKGGEDFLRDCMNHASNHLHKHMEGDRSENHLAKVAWNCLAVRWHHLQKNETLKQMEELTGMKGPSHLEMQKKQLEEQQRASQIRQVQGS